MREVSEREQPMAPNKLAGLLWLVASLPCPLVSVGIRC